MSKAIVAAIVLTILFPLTGQGFEDGCEPLGCGHEVRKLKERVRELEVESGDVVAPRWSLQEQDEAKKWIEEFLKELDEKEMRERKGLVRDISPFSGEGRIHEGRK